MKRSERETILITGKRVLGIESAAVARLVDRIDDTFVRAVELVSQCKGRVIVTGIGKSGMVAKKIAATLTSTGTSAIFLHPAEGVHGDLGMVLKHDLVICISKSGNTDEITRLFPVFKQIGVPIITLTGNVRSALAARSDVVLDTSVTEEACPNDLAPTASTTTAMAMGDALAVALLEKRQFKAEDFAFLHPGGSLGRLLLSVDDIMFSGEKLPLVKLDTPFRDIILEITKKRFGGTCVVDDRHKLVGIITDGDLRRHWQKSNTTDELFARDLLNPNPKTIPAGRPSIEALRLMEHYNILQLVVVDDDHRPVGMIHIHDLLEAGMERRGQQAPEKAR